MKSQGSERFLVPTTSSVVIFFLSFFLLVAAFSAFYVLHGVLRERVYELYAFMAAILVVLMYCIIEYAVFNPSHRTTIKLVSRARGEDRNGH